MSEAGPRRSEPEPCLASRCLPRAWLAAIGLCELAAATLLLWQGWEDWQGGEPTAALWPTAALLGFAWLALDGVRSWRETAWRYLGLAPGELQAARMAPQVIIGHPSPAGQSPRASVPTRDAGPVARPAPASVTAPPAGDALSAARGWYCSAIRVTVSASWRLGGAGTLLRLVSEGAAPRLLWLRGDHPEHRALARMLRQFQRRSGRHVA